MKKSVVVTTISLFFLAACTNTHKVQQDGEKVAVTPTKPEPVLATPIEKTDPEARVISPDLYQSALQESPEIIRNGRYTLVSASPELGQRYLLDQLVTINVPRRNKKVFTASVEQGLRATLKDTGFNLCERFLPTTPSEVSTLFSRPLPKIHYHFGPMKLREALQMLAGPAYSLTLNDVQRTICFKPHAVVSDEPQSNPTEIITTTTEAIEE